MSSPASPLALLTSERNTISPLKSTSGQVPTIMVNPRWRKHKTLLATIVTQNDMMKALRGIIAGQKVIMKVHKEKRMALEDQMQYIRFMLVSGHDRRPKPWVKGVDEAQDMFNEEYDHLIDGSYFLQHSTRTNLWLKLDSLDPAPLGYP